MEKEMNNTEMFEQDAGALVVKNEDLQSVGELAKRAKQLEKEIEELEDSRQGTQRTTTQIVGGKHSGSPVRAGHEVIQNV
jgi:uncharacterized small protein (DUF1192 family)